MSQAAIFRRLKPQTQGRMVRTDQYKYCVYEFGTQRESLVDMKKDPSESTNLVAQKAYQDVLVKHRTLLQNFGKRHGDALVSKILNPGARPFAPTGKK